MRIIKKEAQNARRKAACRSQHRRDGAHRTPKQRGIPVPPFLGIVPIPTLSVDQGDIRFKLDVKPRADGTAGQDAGKGREATFSKGPLSAAASDYVTVKPSASDIPAIEQADEAD